MFIEHAMERRSCAALSLIDEEIFQNFHDSNNMLCANVARTFEEMVREAKISGNSIALKKVLCAVEEVSANGLPVLFAGMAGVGKKTFAKLLHRIGTCGSTSLQILDCREHASAPQYASVDDLVAAAANAYGPGIIILHPEALPARWCKNLFSKYMQEKTNIRFYLTIDINFMDSLFDCMVPNVRNMLRQRTIALPDIVQRNADVGPSILTILAHLNQKNDLHKRIAKSALEKMKQSSYEENFRTLKEVVEEMYSSQGDVLHYNEKLIKQWKQKNMKLIDAVELGDGFQLDLFLRDARKKIITRALFLSRDHQGNAAKLLGISPQAVSKYLQKCRKSSNIQPPTQQDES
ncbi:MAG: sigma 54-interacting transcriptional regulator [Puniceicoccales bacterium]|nr:sigma 54-interacting transcriptional regulator [Puniceicoccales bacterium]